MSASPSRPTAEIAYSLFIDIVGYSLGSMEQQQRSVQELREVVRTAPAFLSAEAGGDLIRLDRGDGVALVFFRDLVAPMQCAVEIARALRNHPELPLRMGIHNGPVTRGILDISNQENVYGDGLNIAQRVMDCGDAGHILLSQRSADDLRQFEMWADGLHDLGEIEVKHGMRLHLYSYYDGEIGNPAIPQRVTEADRAATPEAQNTPARDSVGGAVPLGSEFYIARPVDAEFIKAVSRQESIVLVKGARQMGKTSLLARGLQRAREGGAKIVLTDFQMLNEKHLASVDTLLLTLATLLAGRLGLCVSPKAIWDPDLGANMNMDWFMETEVLGTLSGPIVWGLDEVDRLFTSPYGGEVFGLFRSWHNRRALEPGGPWSRLTLAIAYATEAHLFITDLNQSPFNVGTRLTLEDFTQVEVAELNRRYQEPLRNTAELERFTRLVGGHPYLVRRGLDEMTNHRMNLAELEIQADRDEGLFGDHLRRLLIALTRDPDLTEVVRRVLRGQPCPTAESFYRLRTAGILVGDSAEDARLRCRLYATYLERHLL
jgi:class 3 adenylate cyclase